MAKRIRCSMNHAVFCVTPTARSQLVRTKYRCGRRRASTWPGATCRAPAGESSKIVPTFTGTTASCSPYTATYGGSRCSRRSRSRIPARGQATPSGKRSITTKSCARSASEKYVDPSRRVVGVEEVRGLAAGIHLSYRTALAKSMSQVYHLDGCQGDILAAPRSATPWHRASIRLEHENPVAANAPRSRHATSPTRIARTPISWPSGGRTVSLARAKGAETRTCSSSRPGRFGAARNARSSSP